MKFKSLFWVNLAVGLLLTSMLQADSTDAQALPQELRNLSEDQIVRPKKLIEPYIPLGAKRDNISAEVWIKFTFASGKALAPKIVYCSKEGYQLEKAALMTFREYEFSNLIDSSITEDRIFYTKISFGNPSKAKKKDIPIPQEIVRNRLHEKIIKQNRDEKIPAYIDSLSPDYFESMGTVPELITKVRPQYPIKARQELISCKVTLKVLVSETGEIRDVWIQDSCDPAWTWGFNESSIEAVLQCRFKPAIKDGKPVRVWVTVPYEFIIGK